ERPARRHRGRAEELEGLEALDGRVLPRAAERRDPAEEAADRDDDEPARPRRAVAPLERADPDEHADAAAGDDHADRDALARVLHRLAHDPELHRDEVLRLVLLADEVLPELGARALEAVDEAPEHEARAGVPEIPVEDLLGDRADQGADDRRAEVLRP